MELKGEEKRVVGAPGFLGCVGWLLLWTFSNDEENDKAQAQYLGYFETFETVLSGPILGSTMLQVS